MVWIGVPPALSNRLWARLRARNAVSSFIVFSKSSRCSSVKGCTYLTIITSSGRGEYATKSGLTLMRYCTNIVSKNFWSGTYLGTLDQPPEHQSWDIALMSWLDSLNFPVFQVYRVFALDGYNNWGIADAKLHQLDDAVIRTVDREQQQALIRQMERHTHDQAYFLFLYNPIQLYAVNKTVTFVPYVTMLNLAETSVTEQHWSVRKQKATGQE